MHKSNLDYKENSQNSLFFCKFQTKFRQYNIIVKVFEGNEERSRSQMKMYFIN